MDLPCALHTGSASASQTNTYTAPSHCKLTGGQSISFFLLVLFTASLRCVGDVCNQKHTLRTNMPRKYFRTLFNVPISFRPFFVVFICASLSFVTFSSETGAHCL